jgi:hypothetical protein
MADKEEKTTPTDVSEFDREQLRFFLGDSDMASTLVELNPSLAWLPILAEMNLLQNDAALALWVEQNFASLDAVREVVANIRFFRAESARILEHRLNNQRDRLQPLLAKCWQLIIRHIRNEQPGTLQSGWFQVLPQLKRNQCGSLASLWGAIFSTRRRSGLGNPRLAETTALGSYGVGSSRMTLPHFRLQDISCGRAASAATVISGRRGIGDSCLNLR